MKRKRQDERIKEVSLFYSQLSRFMVLKKQMKGEKNQSINENIKEFSDKTKVIMPKIIQHLELAENTLQKANQATNNEIAIVEKLKRIQLNTRGYRRKAGIGTHENRVNDARRRYSERVKQPSLVEMKKAQFRALKKLINRKTSDSTINSEISSPLLRPDP